MLLCAARRWSALQQLQRTQAALALSEDLKTRIAERAHLRLDRAAPTLLFRQPSNRERHCLDGSVCRSLGCLYNKIAWRDAQLSVEARDTQHPRLAHFADLIGAQGPCHEVPAHRWLAIRRGQQEGVLALRFKWPEPSLLEQMQLYRKSLNAPEIRSDASLLQELVFDALHRP